MNITGNNLNNVNNSQAERLLDAALRLAELGYPVFPLRPGTKEPIFAGGFRTATTDPEQIRKWWRQHPDANIGIAAPDLLVLDLDREESDDFINRTKAELFGDFVPPEIPSIRTPSGGFHYYMRVDTKWAAEWGIGNNIRVLPGIDLKGCGKGYVVAPPSEVNGQPYIFAGGWTELPPLDEVPLVPDKTRLAIERALEKKKPRNNGNGEAPSTNANADWMEALEKALLRIWKRGRRHLVALAIAGYLRKQGKPEREVADLIARVASAVNDEEYEDRLRAVEDTFGKDLTEIAGLSELSEEELETLKPALPSRKDKHDTATFTPHETYQSNGCWRNRLKRISEIQSTDYPELEWLVDGVLPARGLIVLAGRPKSGKSWLALDLALSVAGGADCLGRPTGSRGTTIYLALEDTDARIKERSEIIGLSPDNALIATTWAPADQGGYEELQEMVRELHPTLVIVDTLSSFKAGSKVLKKPQFEIDYEQARKLKSIADENDCCVLLVHHTRKADADDVFDTVSGTLGLNAVADAIAVLQHARGSNSGKLHITGRDVSDEQYHLLFDGGRWKIVEGEAQEAETTRDRILRAIRQWGPIQPRELSRILGSEISYDNIRQLLRRLTSEGIVARDEAGNYSIQKSISCVTVSQGCDSDTVTQKNEVSPWDLRHADRIRDSLVERPMSISELSEDLGLEFWQVRRGLQLLLSRGEVESLPDGRWRLSDNLDPDEWGFSSADASLAGNISRILATGPRTIDELEQELGFWRWKIRRALRFLVAIGRAECRDGRWFDIPEPPKPPREELWENLWN